MIGRTTMIAAILIAPFIGAAHAEGVYLGNTGLQGDTGANTIEEVLRLQNERVKLAQENPDKGSGTPYWALDGVIGAMLTSSAVFGGMAAAFFVRSRGGRYVAQGRG